MARKEMPAELKEQAKELKKIKKNNNVAPLFLETDGGKIAKLLTNLKIMISLSPLINGIGYNDFTKDITINEEPINDNLLNQLRLDVDKQYRMTFTKDDVLTTLGIIARELNTYHPIKRMIESKEWDKEQRTETLFIDYLGAENNEYIRTVAKKWLVGSVARIYQPGVKFELVPILQGKQGKGKSTMADKLGGEFFIDSLKSLGKTKDDFQLLIGAWIVELAELASLNATETENTKSFISARSDKIRLPYERITNDFKRTCVFIGTTNSTEYLNDLTGARRFFPIPLDDEPVLSIFDIEDSTIQQIWAEAYHYYKQSYPIHSDKSLEAMANVYREQVAEEDLLFSDVDTFLDMPVPDNWEKMSLWDKRNYYYTFTQDNKTADRTLAINKTTAKEIATVAFKLESNDRRSKSTITKINLYMSNLDSWQKKAIRLNGKTVKGYMRK